MRTVPNSPRLRITQRQAVLVLFAPLGGFLVDKAIIGPWPLLLVVLALVFTNALWMAGIGTTVMRLH